jgi:hypothetical protein
MSSAWLISLLVGPPNQFALPAPLLITEGTDEGQHYPAGIKSKTAIRLKVWGVYRSNKPVCMEYILRT